MSEQTAVSATTHNARNAIYLIIIIIIIIINFFFCPRYLHSRGLKTYAKKTLEWPSVAELLLLLLLLLLLIIIIINIIIIVNFSKYWELTNQDAFNNASIVLFHDKKN